MADTIGPDDFNYQKFLAKMRKEILKPMFRKIDRRLELAEKNYLAKRKAIKNIPLDPSMHGLVGNAATQQAIYLKNRHIRLYHNSMRKHLGVRFKIADTPKIHQEMMKYVQRNVDLIVTIQPKLLAGLGKDLQKLIDQDKAFDQAAMRKVVGQKYGSAGYNLRRIVRDQTNKAIGQLNEIRQTDTGITHYIWRTVEDERVRSQHVDNAGRKFSWAQIPPDGHPGEAIQCRCSAEPVIPSKKQLAKVIAKKAPQPKTPPKPAVPPPLTAQALRKSIDQDVEQAGFTHIDAGDAMLWEKPPAHETRAGFISRKSNEWLESYTGGKATEGLPEHYQVNQYLREKALGKGFSEKELRIYSATGEAKFDPKVYERYIAELRKLQNPVEGGAKYYRGFSVSAKRADDLPKKAGDFMESTDFGSFSGDSMHAAIFTMKAEASDKSVMFRVLDRGGKSKAIITNKFESEFIVDAGQKYIVADVSKDIKTKMRIGQGKTAQEVDIDVDRMITLVAVTDDEYRILKGLSKPKDVPDIPEKTPKQHMADFEAASAKQMESSLEQWVGKIKQDEWDIDVYRAARRTDRIADIEKKIHAGEGAALEASEATAYVRHVAARRALKKQGRPMERPTADQFEEAFRASAAANVEEEAINLAEHHWKSIDSGGDGNIDVLKNIAKGGNTAYIFEKAMKDLRSGKKLSVMERNKVLAAWESERALKIIQQQQKRLDEWEAENTIQIKNTYSFNETMIAPGGVPADDYLEQLKKLADLAEPSAQIKAIRKNIREGKAINSISAAKYRQHLAAKELHDIELIRKKRLEDYDASIADDVSHKADSMIANLGDDDIEKMATDPSSHALSAIRKIREGKKLNIAEEIEYKNHLAAKKVLKIKEQQKIEAEKLAAFIESHEGNIKAYQESLSASQVETFSKVTSYLNLAEQAIKEGAATPIQKATYLKHLAAKQIKKQAEADADNPMKIKQLQDFEEKYKTTIGSLTKHYEESLTDNPSWIQPVQKTAEGKQSISGVNNVLNAYEKVLKGEDLTEIESSALRDAIGAQKALTKLGKKLDLSKFEEVAKSVSAPAPKVQPAPAAQASFEKIEIAVPPKDIPEMEYKAATAVKTGDRQGSNEGGFFTGSDGVARYVKFYDDPAQSYSEAVSNRIYQALGVQAPDSVLVMRDGKVVGVANKIIDHDSVLGAKNITKLQAERELEGFAADVLLANWDAAGLNLDNMIRMKVGRKLAVGRIDNGGSLLFRAMAGRKNAAKLSDVVEWETFLTQNPKYKQLFDKAGLNSADQIKNAAGQIDAIVRLRKATNNFEDLLPKAGGIAEADRAAILKMLNERAQIMEDTILARLTRSTIETEYNQGDLDRLKNYLAGSYTYYSGGHASAPAKFRKMTKDEYAAVRAYTGSHYEFVNKYLRGKPEDIARYTAEEIEQVKSIMRIANSGLAKLPGYNGEVRRGITLDRIAWREAKQFYAVGSTNPEKAFTSTSKVRGREFGGNAKFYIQSHGGGKDVARISMHSSESEILFAAGTRFRVTRQTERHGTLHIWLEEA